MRTVLVDFSGLPMATPLENSAPTILSSALALAVIASIDALLCAKLTSQPGELRIVRALDDVGFAFRLFEHRVRASRCWIRAKALQRAKLRGEHRMKRKSVVHDVF